MCALYPFDLSRKQLRIPPKVVVFTHIRIGDHRERIPPKVVVFTSRYIEGIPDGYRLKGQKLRISI